MLETALPSRDWLERELVAQMGYDPESLRRANLPRYVLACELQQWHLEITDQVTGQKRCVRWRCLSWRHAGHCRDENMRRKRVRIERALTEHPYQDVCFLVMTIDPKADRLGVELGNSYNAFKELAKMWRVFAKYVKRNWGYAGYVSTVEAHKSGMPHLNVVLVSKALAGDLRRPDAWRVLEELKGAARRAHFGPMMTAEAARKPMNIARYVAKLAVELEDRVNRHRLVDEVEKATQTPTTAPKGTRNMRSSRQFLKALEKRETMKGTERARLVMRPIPRGAGFTVRGSLVHALQLDLLRWAANQKPEQLTLWAA